MLIIIPTYNQADFILGYIKEVVKVAGFADYLVINDASTDRTKFLLKFNDIPHINLPIGFGLNVASRIGVEYAYKNNYDHVLKINCDYNHDPHAINYMVRTMENHNYDIVQLSNFLNKKRPRNLLMFGSRLISSCIRLTTGKKVTDPTNGCYLLNRKIIERFYNNSNFDFNPPTMSYLIKDGYLFKEIQFEVKSWQAKKVVANNKDYLFRYMIGMCLSILLIQPFWKKVHKRELKRLSKRGNNVK